METLSVRCNHCGAPLSVGAETRFVTCRFCHSSLEVKRSDSAVFTEEVARIADNTDKMADSLEIIELQNEIERLDREWAAGHSTTPSIEGQTSMVLSAGALAAFGLIFSLFFAYGCFTIARYMWAKDSGILGSIPIGMGLFALVAGVMGVVKSHSMDDILRRLEIGRSEKWRQHQQRRRELAARLEAKRGR